MRCNIYRLLIVSEIQLVNNSVELRIQWFSNVAVYATWHVSNLCLLLCYALIALVSSALMLGDPIVMKMDIGREVQLWDAISSRLSATSRCCFIATWSCSFGPRLLVHHRINNLLYFTHVFNIVISLSSTSHYY